MAKKNPEFDAYIKKARPFAQPILRRLRTVMHRACPKLEEQIKWGHPSFYYKGPLGGMAAFKEHCAFGFWKSKLLKDAEGVLEVRDRTAMGNLGCLRTVKDLPSDKALASLAKQAAKLNDDGIKVVRATKARPPIKAPPYFMTALRKNKKALATFEAFTPSHKREYLEWITEAKTEATRQKRLVTTIEWLAQGKQRNWKYQNC